MKGEEKMEEIKVTYKCGHDEWIVVTKELVQTDTFAIQYSAKCFVCSDCQSSMR